MKTIFKKSLLPFLQNTLKGEDVNGREFWNLARCMQDENGLQHQLSAEIALLERGAQKNDLWSMCELARSYFYYCGDLFLPMALHYWGQAALQNDNGAKYDLEHLPIVERILAYRSFDGDLYKEIEMKCALLTEWYLHQPWKGVWSLLDDNTREMRCSQLINIVCDVLQIPKVELSIVSNLTFQGMVVDGLAGWDNLITIRKEICIDIERLIIVLFHELGHIVAFEILRKTPQSDKLKDIYKITDERVISWGNKTMGYEVITSEEDPDTLSYGVYTLWATFFYTL